MNIKELVKISHQTALDKGFWNDINVYEKLTRIISEKLMLIVTEISEACEALRNNNKQKEIDTKDVYGTDKNHAMCTCHKETRKFWEKDTFEDELADVVIRVADLCGKLNIDLEWQIQKKLEYNKSRPHKHGKNF